MELTSVLSGLMVGLLVGLTGVGGGSLMAPILILIVGVAPATAVGTDLWFAAGTKLVGGAVHRQRRAVDLKVLRRLCIGSLPASAATLLLLWLSGSSQVTEGLVLKLLGVVLVATACSVILRSRLHAWSLRIRDHHRDELGRVQPLATIVAGALLGVLVTLTSIGAGALGAAMLLYLYPIRMSANRLVGTDVVHAVPLTLLAGSGHLLMGNVDLLLLASLLAGSIPGVVLGSFASSRVPDAMLRTALSVVLLAVGVKMSLA